MQRYDTYKDSGVKWLGEIPSHWEVIPMKYCMQIKNGMDYKQVVADYGYPVIGSGGQFAYASDYMHDGEVVFFGRKGTIDKPLHFKGKFWAVDTMFYAIPKKIYGKFLYYVGLTIPYKYYSTATALPSMTQTDLGNNPICFPPLEEQTAIANYLDTATAKIDAAIAQQQKMIDLLNERKQIIINRAVTKGLNPNAKMKDSGVEWIGEVPEHWEVMRMRYLCSITTGNKDTINRVDDGLYPFYVRSPKVERINTYSYDGEAVLMAGDGVGAGKVFHYVNGKFDYHQRVYNFYNIKKIKAKLLYYYMKSHFRYVIEQLSAKSTVDSVRLNMIQDFLVVIPPMQEQLDLMEYLDSQMKNLDDSISMFENQISLLQERKQIIINEVVTGKVKMG